MHPRRAALLTALLMLPLAAAVPPAWASAASPPTVEVRALDVGVTITNHYAVTTVESTLFNPTMEPAEFVLTIASGEVAVISRFALTLEGRTYESQVKSAEDAKAAYEEARASGQAGGLIEERDTLVRNYLVSVPANASLRTHLTYEEFLYRAVGQYQYRFPLVATAGGRTIQAVDIRGGVTGQAAITSFSVEEGTATRASPTAFSFGFAATDLEPTAPFNVTWREELPSGAGTLLTHTTPEGVAFIHTFTAEGSVSAQEPIPKDIVFVIDYSGSMSGLKIQQAKAAFGAVIDDLRPEDRFSVVRFDGATSRWQGALVTASDANRQAAREWVEASWGGGSTNIDGALKDGLQLLSSQAGRAPIVVFLTDGLASAGETDDRKIRDNLRARNVAAAAVFTIGFGSDVDEPLLRQMALENNGVFRRIYVAQDASAQIQGFYATFGTPLYTDVRATYEPAPLWSTATEFGTAFEGSDITVAGMLPPGTSSVKATVSATTAGGQVVRDLSTSTAAMESGDIVSRQVAYARLKHLEDRALLGDDDAKREATDLALAYGFVSKYTSLVVVVPEALAGAAVGDQAPSLIAGRPTYNAPPSSQGPQYLMPPSAPSSASPGLVVPALIGAMLLAAVLVGFRRRAAGPPEGKR